MNKLDYNNQLNNSEFAKTLLSATYPLFLRHMKEIDDVNTDVELHNYGTKTEVQLKAIHTKLGLILSYFDDLQMATKFLSVDREKIQLLHSDNIEQEDYYKYHYDNFLTRIVTSIDICGKIGNEVYDLKIEDRYCNWSAFANHSSMKDSVPSKKTIDFSKYLETLRKYRHEKVHFGTTKYNHFSGLIFWNDFNNAIKLNIDERTRQFLEERTEKELNIRLTEIEEIIETVIYKTFDFLNSMADDIKKIIKIYSCESKSF